MWKSAVEEHAEGREAEEGEGSKQGSGSAKDLTGGGRKSRTRGSAPQASNVFCRRDAPDRKGWQETRGRQWPRARAEKSLAGFRRERGTREERALAAPPLPGGGERRRVFQKIPHHS